MKKLAYSPIMSIIESSEAQYMSPEPLPDQARSPIAYRGN